MGRIKISFCDFWPGFITDNYFLSLLNRYYLVEIDNVAPDYLFYSTYGVENLKYPNAIKILFSGENVVPDFNFCDYALGFHHLNFEDRYLRFPLYIIYAGFNELLSGNKLINEELLLNRKFCNFVYSNSTFADPKREYFFKKLSLYKRVDSGGRFLNNLGYNVKDKVSFVSNYKFTIAFENSSVNGYTTEKIMEPMRVNSIPIYWGNPLVNLDFNEDSFINCMKYNSLDEAIDAVIKFDKNDDEYISLIKTPWLSREQMNTDWETILLRFLQDIFNQPLDAAKRYPRFGFNKYKYEQSVISSELFLKRQKINQVKAKIKNYLPWKK